MPTTETSIDYQGLLRDITHIFMNSSQEATIAVNKIRLRSYWNIGKRIIEEEQKNLSRAPYGTYLLEKLSEDLTQKFGGGFSLSNLKYMRQYYLKHPEKGQTCDQLNWSHQKRLLAVKDDAKRRELTQRAVDEQLSVRDLTQLIKSERYETEEFDDSQIEAPDHAPLVVSRGRPYHYFLKVLKGEERPRVDLGFSIYAELPLDAGFDLKDRDVIVFKRQGPSRVERVENISKGLYTYSVRGDRLISGDTLECRIDLGFGMVTRQTLTLRHVSVPELTSPKGQQAKAFVEKIMASSPELIAKIYGSERHGRYEADLFFLEGEIDPERVADKGYLLNQRLLDEGLARKI